MEIQQEFFFFFPKIAGKGALEGGSKLLAKSQGGGISLP